jgi:histidyl-tRNA synthetase
MNNFQPPKGMKDIDIVEMKKRKWIYSIIRNVLDTNGFEEIEPVSVEMYETLAAKAGEDNLNEVYVFCDKAGRKLGLRFDLTVGITRMVSDMRVQAPIKLYCISNMWRYDNPQKGRYRCFSQWDIECFGTNSFEADAEIIKCSFEIMKKLGLDIELRINNRKIVQGILEYIGINEPKQLEGAMRTIDKLDKLGRQAIIKEFSNYDITDMQSVEIINALKRKGEPKKIYNQIVKDFPKNEGTLKDGLLELKGLIDILEEYKVLSNCILDLSIVRGIAYYSGSVFEAYDIKSLDLGAIFAGGRFDKLMAQYGVDMPAVGIAGGVERLILSLEKQNLLPCFDFKGGVFVVGMKEEFKKNVRQIAQKIRIQKKINAEYDICARSFSKQIKYAEKQGFEYIVIIGENEIKTKKAKIKNIKTKKEEEINI